MKQLPSLIASCLLLSCVGEVERRIKLDLLTGSPVEVMQYLESQVADGEVCLCFEYNGLQAEVCFVDGLTTSVDYTCFRVSEEGVWLVGVGEHNELSEEAFSLRLHMLSESARLAGYEYGMVQFIFTPEVSMRRFVEILSLVSEHSITQALFPDAHPRSASQGQY